MTQPPAQPPAQPSWDPAGQPPPPAGQAPYPPSPYGAAPPPYGHLPQPGAAGHPPQPYHPQQYPPQPPPGYPHPGAPGPGGGPAKKPRPVLAVILLLLLVAGAGSWYLTAGQQESRYGDATAVRQSGVLAPGTYAELAAAGKKVLGADETHTYPGDVEITVSGLTAFTPADDHLAQNVRGVAYKVTVAIAYHGEEEPLSAIRIPILAFGGGGDEERELTQLDELRDSSVDHTLAREDRDLLWEPGETKTVEFAFDAPPGTTYVVITVENPSTYRRTAGDWRLS